MPRDPVDRPRRSYLGLSMSESQYRKLMGALRTYPYPEALKKAGIAVPPWYDPNKYTVGGGTSSDITKEPTPAPAPTGPPDDYDPDYWTEPSEPVNPDEFVPIDITDYSFWDNFVNEWVGNFGKSVRDMFKEDDLFVKEQMDPAISGYQDTLRELAGQASGGTGLFSPVSFGMEGMQGRASFVPRSNFLRAETINKLGLQDVLQEANKTELSRPYRGALNYLSKLEGLGLNERTEDLAKELAELGHQYQKDLLEKQLEAGEGGWLDIIGDVIDIGGGITDLIGGIF